ncbi:MAG: glycosyltransferase [Crocinitomicaceae bacterium]|nr:glycosyltransferase [Crocinitomicaceae bacterium]
MYSILIYLIIQASFMFLFILTGAILQFIKERKRKGNEKIKLGDLTVIIPFRDEESRIKSILNSYENSLKTPAEIIFVNDHSSDNSVDEIKKHLGKLPFQIIQLNKNESGKKTAIQKGVLHSKKSFILTQDADIEFSSNYFSNLEKINQDNLIILPVIFQSKKIINTDVILANALNYSATGFSRPVLASGANLIFKKEHYINYAEIDSHKHLASGDDIFLLNAFLKNNLTVFLCADKKVAVKTSSEKTLKNILRQRARWISKTKHVNDLYAIILAIIQMLISSTYPILIIYGVMELKLLDLILFILIKALIDQVSLGLYFIRLRLIKEFLFLPFYSVIYPFYSLLILINSMLLKQEWKGREIINSN